ncbi:MULTISPECIES: DUF523 domain-containing protein [Staphylococcus]|uniref:DUF523 domain-containing protein n=1 Tax=Staphylococcus TaxID=1279 RepID=UPI0021D0862D|nr:DUF523 domain-containing protein [Staphylococcus sp. IVB6181]UXV34915.1 DUF523 domain-containing protein [Staphylococcus sp. IVB6181]
MIAISACLIGDNVRYDGSNKLNTELKSLVEQGKAISICPEVLGGLLTPREAAEIVGGDGRDVWQGTAKVITKTGEDVTESFKSGAQFALEILKEQGCTGVILKSKSPSCGWSEIYDGSFSGQLKQGKGVSAALFEQQGITLANEFNWKGKFEV